MHRFQHVADPLNAALLGITDFDDLLGDLSAAGSAGGRGGAAGWQRLQRASGWTCALDRARYWQELGITYEPHRPSDTESVVTIVRITGGNVRLVERLMNEVARIMTINNLDTITPAPVEAARDVLVVGA